MNTLAKQIEAELHHHLLVEHFQYHLDGLCLNLELNNNILEVFKNTISVYDWSAITLLKYFGFEYERFSEHKLIEHLYKAHQELMKLTETEE